MMHTCIPSNIEDSHSQHKNLQINILISNLWHEVLKCLLHNYEVRVDQIPKHSFEQSSKPHHSQLNSSKIKRLITPQKETSYTYTLEHKNFCTLFSLY